MAKHFKTQFPDDSDYYEDDNAKNRTEGNVLDDDFDDVVAAQLTAPTAEATVKLAVEGGKDIPVILWRGTTGPSATEMAAFGCAKGTRKDTGTARPTEAQRKEQVAVGRAFPEFTTKKDLSFSFKHYLVVVRVSAKYLARGSVTEQGWVCQPTAPVEVLEVVDRTLGFAENLQAVNAS